MKYKKTNDGKYLIRLERDERIVSSLVSLAETLGIRAGIVSGIGAVRDPLLGYFDVNQKRYIERNFRGNFELLSLKGNLSYKEGKPIFHIHIIIGDGDLKSFGGHLVDTEVTVTAELILVPLDCTLERVHDEWSNLWLWNL